jgi:hypothetical protein
VVVVALVVVVVVVVGVVVVVVEMVVQGGLMVERLGGTPARHGHKQIISSGQGGQTLKVHGKT